MILNGYVLEAHALMLLKSMLPNHIQALIQEAPFCLLQRVSSLMLSSAVKQNVAELLSTSNPMYLHTLWISYCEYCSNLYLQMLHQSRLSVPSHLLSITLKESLLTSLLASHVIILKLSCLHRMIYIKCLSEHIILLFTTQQ